MYIKKKFKTSKGLINYLLKQRPASYLDKDCLIKTTKSNLSRSFNEIIQIVQTRFKKASEKRIAYLVKEFCKDSNSFLTFCTMLDKVVIKRFEPGYCDAKKIMTSHCYDNHYTTMGEDNRSAFYILDLAEDYELSKR